MAQDSFGNIQIGGSAKPVPPSASPQEVIVRTEKVMLQVAAQAEESRLDPNAMLRVLVLLAAPVHDPRSPDRAPNHLDLHQEWHVLAGEVRKSHSPILLAFPGALLYQLSETGIDKVEYEDTEHYRLTREFLLRRELFFRELFAAEE